GDHERVGSSILDRGKGYLGRHGGDNPVQSAGICHQQSAHGIPEVLATGDCCSRDFCSPLNSGKGNFVGVGGGVINRGHSVIHTNRTTGGAIIGCDRSPANRTDSFENINVVAPWRKCSSCGCRQVRGWIVGRKYVEGLPGLILQEIVPCVKIILLNEGQDLKGPAGRLILDAKRCSTR